ncbi:C40 family peptidase [Alkalicoccus urumqiensis]|nr:C40 family peptidase [Alkalicoccus urumqiensis]
MTLVISMVLSAILFFSPGESFSDDLLTEAEEQLGAPYEFGGTTPEGFDCSGFAGYVFAQFDVILPRSTSEQFYFGESVKKEDLQAGDIVFFQTRGDRVSHSGIYIEDGEFIHASATNGISISSIEDPYYWKERYLGARRVFEESDDGIRTLGDIDQARKRSAEAAVEAEAEELEEEVRDWSYSSVPYFTDVASEYWAFSSIQAFTEAGILAVDDKTFYPADGATRGVIAELLTTALELDPAEPEFDDVDTSHVSSDSIGAVAEAGYMNGIGSGLFEPDRVLTRAELAVVLANLFELDLSPEGNAPFDDLELTHWAYPAVEAMHRDGLIGGYEDGTFRAANDVTRAEAVTMLLRALKR